MCAKACAIDENGAKDHATDIRQKASQSIQSSSIASSALNKAKYFLKEIRQLLNSKHKISEQIKT